MGACISQPIPAGSRVSPEVVEAGRSGPAVLLGRGQLLTETGSSAASKRAIINASIDELVAVFAGLDDESRKKMSAALNSSPVSAGPPAEVVLAKMKSFEEHYNADEAAKSVAIYADECRVTVVAKSAPTLPTFSAKTAKDVAGFLSKMRNDRNATNIKISTTSVDGNTHEDVWVTDIGAGSRKATWEQIGGDWKIVKDEIKFTPKAARENVGGVHKEVVIKAMQTFEDSYNAGDLAKTVGAYAAACDVVVNKGRVFAGQTPGEVAGFFGQTRDSSNRTNIKLVVTKVEGKVHEAMWVADRGSGSCKATWEEIGGQWRIVKEQISFVPRVVA